MEAAALRRALWRDPRVVVWAYGFVIALSIAAQAGLPGYPNYGEGQSMLGSALIIDGAVLIGLSWGSKVAWWVAVFFSVGSASMGLLFGFADGGPKDLLIGALGLVALLFLLSPAMDARIWNRPPGHDGGSVLILRESSRR